jgi:hypothetical protein
MNRVYIEKERRITMNKIKIFKFVGIGLSVAGMLVTAFVGDKENKLQLEALVNSRLGNK